jgi:hypothetical protein
MVCKNRPLIIYKIRKIEEEDLIVLLKSVERKHDEGVLYRMKLKEL